MKRQSVLMTVWLAASGVFAQSPRAAVDHTAGMRPLTRAEGRLIVLATSSASRRIENEADCSHLVHDLYERAGFPYEYVNSHDLYTGNANFVRVHYPQPGDLIVWRGHVGIVIDAREHSFFSSLRSGVDTEFYDSAYWRARGIARFYRYVTDKPFRSARTLEATRRLSHRVIAPSHSRPENVQADGLKDASAANLASAAALRTTAEIPSEKILQTSGKTPASEEVASALAEINEDSGAVLREGSLENPDRPVIVYNVMRVTAVSVKGTRGTAEARVEAVASLPATEPPSQPGWQDLPLELQKTKRGWLVRRSTEAAYVPREVALQVLSARLASLAQNADLTADEEREQIQIVRFLNLLVADDNAASAQRD